MIVMTVYSGLEMSEKGGTKEETILGTLKNIMWNLWATSEISLIPAKITERKKQRCANILFHMVHTLTFDNCKFHFILSASVFLWISHLKKQKRNSLIALTCSAFCLKNHFSPIRAGNHILTMYFELLTTSWSFIWHPATTNASVIKKKTIDTRIYSYVMVAAQI